MACDGGPVSRSGHWWRRPRWIVATVAAGLVVIGAVLFAIAWSQRGADEASVEEAVEGLDDGAAGTKAGFLRPAGGVYVYEGSGTEQLSLLSTGQTWGPRLPGTVTRDDDGCWTFRIDYSTNHRQWTDYCPRGRVLEEEGGRTFQSFDFVVSTIEDRNVFVCDPPGEAIRVDADPGSSWPQSCVGRSADRGTEVTSSGTNTFVGIESVEVEGEPVRAYRYRADRVLSGDQTGTETVDTWFRVPDGLPLRATRSVRVESPSPIGAVTYTEEGTYTLTSLAPRSR